MYSQMMWVSVAALLVAVVFSNSGANYQWELSLVVSIAAAVVLSQAFQVKNYRWAACFLTIALLFDPAVPVFRFAGDVGFALVVVSIAPFAISLFALKPLPQLSISSITDRTPGSQSL